MEFAIWAYPWDLVDEGIDNVAGRLGELGISEINLATNYHHVQTFCPHNPERRTFFARSSSYFQPRGEYGALEPIPNETMGDADWVQKIADGLADTDISLNSWTVGVHNSRLGMSHPETAIENAFGDKLVFGLCPSNPKVQQYLGDLIADLTERDIFERIELETFDYFYGTGWGWHHDKFHARLGTLGEFLFGICFCTDCRTNAREAGIDVQRARSTVRETIDEIVAGAVPADADVTGWLRAHQAVTEYIDIRERTLSNLYGQLRKAAGQTSLGYYAGFEAPGRTWMQGADLTSLADHVDYYTVAAYESSKEDAVDNVNEIDALTTDIPLHAGVLPAYPEVTDSPTLENILEGLDEIGVPRVSFYNYGLLPEENLSWIESAIETVK